MSSKIILGTAQFGLDYGINNRRGKIPKKEIFKILNWARKNNIDTLDTAPGYGRSEKIIGEFIQKKGINFNIVSKLPASGLNEIKTLFKKSTKNLRTKSLYGYLFHSFDSYLKKPIALEQLEKYKKEGLIKKIGFSLYYPQELAVLLKKNIKFDLVQVPYSLIDQRFTPFLSQLKRSNIEIHTRSIFLQGLLFKNPNKLKPEFGKITSKLKTLNKISQDLQISIAAICLNFVSINKYVDKIIIGVDNFENLKENINSFKYRAKVQRAYNQLLDLKETNEEIILPFNWS